MSVSGPRNRRNESAKFLEPETDKMVQFLGPETVLYGRVELYANCTQSAKTTSLFCHLILNSNKLKAALRQKLKKIFSKFQKQVDDGPIAELKCNH